MITGRWPTQLNKDVSYRWSKQGFRYLGITLTHHPMHLFEANYNTLIKQIKNDMIRWEILPLSLFGRVETVRMKLLPRLLFLFQSLPVGIPASIFNLLNRLISTFIWQNKRPRVRLKAIFLPKDKGGLGLPNVTYYWAAQLTAIVAWIRKDEDTGWAQIEQSASKGVLLSVLPYIDIKSVNKVKIVNEWIKDKVVDGS